MVVTSRPASRVSLMTRDCFSVNDAPGEGVRSGNSALTPDNSPSGHQCGDPRQTCPLPRLRRRSFRRPHHHQQRGNGWTKLTNSLTDISHLAMRLDGTLVESCLRHEPEMVLPDDHAPQAATSCSCAFDHDCLSGGLVPTVSSVSIRIRPQARYLSSTLTRWPFFRRICRARAVTLSFFAA